MPAMGDPLTNLPSSRLLGSVPAAIASEQKPANYNANSYYSFAPVDAPTLPDSKMQIFPPLNGGSQGNETGTTSGGGESLENRWKGFFSIASYSPYFDVDTDTVLGRIANSVHPLRGNLFHGIHTIPDLSAISNLALLSCGRKQTFGGSILISKKFPDLTFGKLQYGPVWISTTLVFILAAVGNCATYLMEKRENSSTSWSFDVTYVNLAACSVYGYLILLPLAYHFLLQYFGLSSSLIRLWCMWGYSFFIFLPACILLVIPVEFLRWIIIIVAGAASACFVGFNIKTHIEGNDLILVVISSLVLQFALAIFFKIYFFA